MRAPFLLPILALCVAVQLLPAAAQPRTAQQWLDVAQTNLKQNRAKPAADAAAQAARLAGKDIRVLQPLAFVYFALGDFRNAALIQDRYAALPGADSNAWLRAAELHLRAGEAKAAIASATRGLAREPGRAEILNVRAKSLALDQQPAAAIRDFEAAIAGSRYSESFHFDLIQFRLHREEFAEALAASEAALTVFDKSAQLELTRGVALYGLRRFGDAAGSFLRAASLDPDIEQPYLFLAKMIDQAAAQLDEIQERAASFLARRQDSPAGYFLLAKVSAAKGEPVSAREELLKKAIAIRGEMWEAHFELGLAQEDQDWKSAMASFEKAAALNPQEASIPYRQARVLDRLGRPAEAAAARARHEKLVAAQRSRGGGMSNRVVF